MRYLTKLVCALSFCLAGCKDLNSIASSDAVSSVRSNDTTWVVTVGMENSQFAGACPGAGIDAERMTSLFRVYTPHVKAFSSQTATKAAVRSALVEAVANAELVIFYYSGHGGQQRFWDTGSDEDDGQDEYLCFYDTYMRDNEVWQIISQSKGRVFCIFDACHSEDLYRNMKPITLTGAMPLAVTHEKQGPINLLVWSGCPSDTYSYGSSSGGKMTNTLLNYFDSRKTYDYLWSEMENDSALKRYEIIQRTVMGSGFVGKPVFL